MTGGRDLAAAEPSAWNRHRHRRIIGLAIPAMGALVADPILGLVDTAVVGRLGAEQLAALGVGVAVLATVSWVFNFLVYGTTATVAHAVGAGDLRRAGRRVAHAGWAAIGIGVVVGATVFVGAKPILLAMGATADLIDPAVTYLRVRSVGIVGLLLGYVGHGAFRGVSNTKTPMGIAIGANVVNGGLDVLLVFGLGMGLAGAAWATVAAEFAAALLFALLIRRAGLPLGGHGLPSAQEVRDLVTVSRDLFLRTGGLVFGLLLVTSAGARIGAVTTAAHQVLFQVWITVSLLMDGFAIAGQAMVGTALGGGRSDEARATARALTAWGIVVGSGVAVTLLALGGQVPRLLTDDPAVLSAASGTWAFAMATLIPGGVVFVLEGVLIGASDFAFLRNWTIIAATAAAVLANVAVWAEWGLFGLWIGMMAMVVIRFLAVASRVRAGTWVAVAAQSTEG